VLRAEVTSYFRVNTRALNDLVLRRRRCARIPHAQEISYNGKRGRSRGRMTRSARRAATVGRGGAATEGRRRQAPAEELTRPQIRPAMPPLPSRGVHSPERPPILHLATTPPPAHRRRSSRGGTTRPHISPDPIWAGAVVAACGS
jgi:hypothetical protein